jgi:inner membrane protein involved in colicin E2 resistance
MKLTLWVRPDFGGQYLVQNWKDIEQQDFLKKFLKEWFESDDVETFRKAVEKEKENWQYYDELDTEQHHYIELDTNYDHKEPINFIWVMMSKNDLKSLSDFGGW